MSEPPKAPCFEIPDLELEPAASQRRPPTPELPSDDFELIPTTSALELGDDLKRDAAAGPSDRAPWPTGRSRTPDQLPIDATRVQQLADYGPAPTTAALAPLYAFRVYSRRAPLKSIIGSHVEALERAETERDFALMQLADGLREALAQNQAFNRLLEPIREVEKLATERSAAFAHSSDGYRAQLQQFEDELRNLRGAEAAAESVVAERRASEEASALELQRADAKHKRVQIEIRGVLDLARQALGPAGGDMPPAQAARLSELRAQESALSPELERARSAHAQTCSALRQAEDQRSAVVSDITRIERRRSDASKAIEPQLTASAAGVSEAENKRLQALADVARAVLAARGGVPLPEATLAALRSHDSRVEHAASELETRVRALHSYDAGRVKQGVTVVLWALGLLVLAILLKAVL